MNNVGSPFNMRGGPLSGFRILDLSSVIMGPYSTQILADYGAEILAVEPVGGAENRGMGPSLAEGLSDVVLNLLRNKKSICLNLKDAGAREAVLAIAATCDAVVTNLRTAPLSRLGLTYEDLRAVRSDLVFCQAQGFRNGSERQADPAYDDIIQSETGLAFAAQQIDGIPRLAPTIMADKVCGTVIAGAVTAALLHRERTGEGQFVEVPMFDVMASFVLVEHSAGLNADQGGAGYQRILSPHRGPQKTADGWINIMPYSRDAYNHLFNAGGRPDLVDDPRTAPGKLSVNAPSLYADLIPCVTTKSTEEWATFCTAHSIPFGRIASIEEVAAAFPTREHPVAGGYKEIPAPVRFKGTNDTHSPTPEAGAHTRETLMDCGISADQIDDLFRRGVAFEATRVSQPEMIPE